MDISVWWLAFLLNYNFREIFGKFAFVVFGVGIDVSLFESAIRC